MKSGTAVLAICETRWKGVCDFATVSGGRIYYLGSEKGGRSGVGFYIAEMSVGSVRSYRCVSDRLMTLRLDASPFPVTLISWYAPTTRSDAEEIERFFPATGRNTGRYPKGRLCDNHGTSLTRNWETLEREKALAHMVSAR